MDRSLRRRLEARFGASLLGPVRQRHDETEIRIAPGDLPEVMRALHDEPEFGFEALMDLCGVDTGTTMQTVYHLWSPTSPDWLRVVADGLSRDDPRVPSVTFLWKGAEWQEREAYDMFGIAFEGNRDLRRIYMPAGLHQLPAAQGLLPARRRRPFARRRRPPHGTDPRARRRDPGRSRPADQGQLRQAR